MCSTHAHTPRGKISAPQKKLKCFLSPNSKVFSTEYRKAKQTNPNMSSPVVSNAGVAGVAVSTRSDVEDVASVSSSTSTSSLDISLNAILERQLKLMTHEFGMRVIDAIAEEYGMDAKEIVSRIHFDEITLKRVTMSRKTAKSSEAKSKSKNGWDKPSILLPWTGVAYSNPNFCQGIRKNYGLFSQCVMKKTSDSIYCTTCKKNAEKTEHGMPAYGNVEYRIEQGIHDTYTPPDAEKSQNVLNYGNFMEAQIKKKPELKIVYTEETVRSIASNFGIVDIPDEFFEVKDKKKPGRPKKSDTEEEVSMVDKAKKEKKTKKTKKAKESEAEDAESMDEEAIKKIEQSAGYDSEVSESKKAKKAKKVKDFTKFKFADKDGNALKGKAYDSGKIEMLVDGELVDLADMGFTFEDGKLYNDKKPVKMGHIAGIIEEIRRQIAEANAEESDEEED